MIDSTDTDTTADEKPGRLRRFHERFMVEERVLSAAAKRALYLTGAGLIVVGLVGFFVVLDSILEADDLSFIDEPIETWLESGQDDWLTTVMIILAIGFGPIAMPIIILVTTVAWGFLAEHAWRPILLAGGMILGVIIVQVLAPVIARDRPVPPVAGPTGFLDLGSSAGGRQADDPDACRARSPVRRVRNSKARVWN